MTRTALFLALLATAIAVPAVADDTFISPPAADAIAAGKIATARAERAERAAAKSGTLAAAAAVTDTEVGDANSFGKPVKWAGLLSGFVALTEDCTPPVGEPGDPSCITLAPAPASTTFNMPDVASITLPGKSAETFLCHTQTPILSYQFYNPTATMQNASLRVRVTYRIESEVLNDPTLIDPTTELPFAGSFETALSAFGRITPIEAGRLEQESLSSTRACIGGLISQRALISQYGLTPAQAKKFFRKPITITMSLSGSARMVQDALINVGTRFTSD